MRENAFNEKILQPNDTYKDLEDVWEDRFGELPPEELVVEINPTFDEVYKIGGEFRDPATGEGVAFDGFATVDGARAWLENSLDIDPDWIEILEAE
jgi:hypothetical protein